MGNNMLIPTRCGYARAGYADEEFGRLSRADFVFIRVERRLGQSGAEGAPQVHCLNTSCFVLCLVKATRFIYFSGHVDVLPLAVEHWGGVSFLSEK